MKPAPFKFFAPKTVEETLNHLSQHGEDAKLLAGGQSLIPTMNFRMAQPAVLVDLNKVKDLDYIRTERSKGLVIGAMTRQCSLENNEDVAKHAPLLHETMPYIAHPQIRNRGTIGGSIVHADPAAELPAVMIALNAQFAIQGKQEKRWVNADKFFIGMFATEVQPDEILTEIAIPSISKRSGWGFEEVARRHGDYAMVGVAVNISLDWRKRCQQAKIVFLSVGDAPIEAKQAEEILIGQSIDDELIQQAAQRAATQDIDPGSDIHASAKYRRHLAKVLATRALKKALARAQA